LIINRQFLRRLRPIIGMLTGKTQAHGVSHGLSEAGYDIRIAENVLHVPMLGLLPFTLRWGGAGLPSIRMGRFMLASAMEEFDMHPSLVGVVHDKSSWARRCMTVCNTVAEPGWKGFLTLELIFHSWLIPVFVRQGSGIAQVLFHEVAQPAKYAGKYQGQEAGPQAARKSK
jgi:dCTP deaminase